MGHLVFVVRAFGILVLLNGNVLVTTEHPPVEYPLKAMMYNANLTESYGCENEMIWCLRKCCLENYRLKGKTCVWDDLVQKTINDHLNVTKGAEVNFTFLQGALNCGSYRLDPKNRTKDAFKIESDGKLVRPKKNKTTNLKSYCVEHFDDIGVSAMLCFSDEDSPTEKDFQTVLTIGMIISMPFLLLTFIVYALLPERNIHGVCLMCYVITLFCAYVLLVLIRSNYEIIDKKLCTYAGLTCMFFFLVSFFWMNVMSIDICWTFSGMRGSGSKRQYEKYTLLIYNAYAWGVPLLLVILVALLTFSKGIPLEAWYNPGMGQGQCWFKQGISNFVFFYLPIAIIMIVNLVLFTITAYKIKQVQRDTSILRKDDSRKHNYENDKQRFTLYLKLLLAMGVNWIMDVISWAVNWQVKDSPKSIWYVTDFCNALYGVFIFFIFVFKKKIWKMLKRRYYSFLACVTTQSGDSPQTSASSLNQSIVLECKSPNDATSNTQTQVD